MPNNLQPRRGGITSHPPRKSRSELVFCVAAFAAKLKGDEKSEAQTFLFHLLSKYFLSKSLTNRARCARFRFMQVTIDIPDELAGRLESERGRVTEIIQFGLNELGWLEHEIEHCALAEEIVAFLACRPSPEDIAAFRPSKASVARGRELLEKNRANSLTLDERRELESMARLNRFFMELKARVRQPDPSAS